MLITEKLQTYKFSDTEQQIISFIQEQEENIQKYTTAQIARETFTSPSLLIRIAQKLGYSGWSAFKEDYVSEIRYLKSHFVQIDANYPFTARDNIMSIAGKITNLYEESAKDTLSLLDHDTLQKAVRLIEKASCVRLFCVSNLNNAAQQFAHLMTRINKHTVLNRTSDDMYHDAMMMTSDDCAIVISYSGETIALIKTCQYLKENHVPFIAITSMGENSISSAADVTLHISTREKSYSKIAGFSSYLSISLILDILYSCYFQIHYDRNLQYKLDIAAKVEKDRKIKNIIIQESE